MSFFVSNYNYKTNLKPCQNEIGIANALLEQLEIEIRKGLISMITKL